MAAVKVKLYGGGNCDGGRDGRAVMAAYRETSCLCGDDECLWRGQRVMWVQFGGPS